ncbi:MAG: RNA polymerase sigma factor [Crocinitomicaceae bacterium]
MRGVALRYASCETAADDILQEAFIKVFDQLKNYQDQGNIGGWMYRITVNTALQAFRSQKRRNNHEDSFSKNSEHSVSNQSLENLKMEALLKLIQELPEGYRVIFNLRAIEGYTHREIAEMLEISEGTSKSQYARAKKHLQAQITAEEKELKTRSYGS